MTFLSVVVLLGSAMRMINELTTPASTKYYFQSSTKMNSNMILLAINIVSIEGDRLLNVIAWINALNS